MSQGKLKAHTYGGIVINTMRVILPSLPPSSAACINTLGRQRANPARRHYPFPPSVLALPSLPHLFAIAAAPRRRTTVCQTGSSNVMEFWPSICPEYWSCCWPALIILACPLFRLLS